MKIRINYHTDVVVGYSYVLVVLEKKMNGENPKRRFTTCTE